MCIPLIRSRAAATKFVPIPRARGFVQFLCGHFQSRFINDVRGFFLITIELMARLGRGRKYIEREEGDPRGRDELSFPTG